MLTVYAGQRGQALVGVMVVMLVLFALAGAVAIGASTLLGNRGQSGATKDDFQVHSAVNDSVAQIAGANRICGAPPPLPSPSPTPAPTSTPAPLTLALPNSAGAQAHCLRLDAVLPDTVQRLQAPQPSNGTCPTIALGQVASRVGVLFDARAVSGSGWAYLDTRPGPVACAGAFPTPSPGLRSCRKSFASTQVLQVAVTCDFAATEQAYLHYDVPGPGPKWVFVAKQDPQRPSSEVGFLYLIASGTGGARPDFEESLFYLSNDGSVRHLLYEAPLP